MPPLVWALATSLALHALLLFGHAPKYAPASALSQLEVRLGDEGLARAGAPTGAAMGSEQAAEAAAPLRPTAGPRHFVPRSPRAGRKVGAVPGQPLSQAAETQEAGPAGGGGAAAGVPVPLESSGARLVLPLAVRAIYRQVAGEGQRELVWSLDAGRYTLHWTERRDDGAVVSRTSAHGLLAYDGLLPLHYRELRAGRAPRLWRFDWAAGVVEEDDSDSAHGAVSLTAGDVDPASLLVQIVVLHQVLPEAQRHTGVRLGIATAGDVAVRLAARGDTTARARYELHGAVPSTQLAAVELATGQGFLPVQVEELAPAGRTIWQLATLEDLSAD